MNSFRFAIMTFALLTSHAAYASEYESKIQPLLKQYCVKCHGGEKKVRGKVNFVTIDTPAKVAASYELWESAVTEVVDGFMPPEDEPQPTKEEVAELRDWYQRTFVDSVEAHPGYFRPRRLAAYEYRNTLQSLFGFELDVAIREAEQTLAERSLVMKLLPTDPPGPSGFTNDTSVNPLTTVVWNQYAYLADNALGRLFSPRHRTALEAFIGEVADSQLTNEQAGQLLRRFARRAFRRDVNDTVIADSLAAIAGKRGPELQEALRIELKTILMSPMFIYRGLMMDVPRDKQHPVDEFELAERLSYFLWADMPDEQLMQAASDGNLSDPTVYREQIGRMLASPKSRSLAVDFGEQWFSLKQIEKLSKNPPQAHALATQPLDYIEYLFREGRPLVELIDSNTAFANPHTAKFYPRDRKQMGRYRKQRGIEVERVANQRITLNNTPERGGLLTIPGVLGMNRGPVIRGTWILERILGEHLPEPPPDVGQVKPSPPGKKLTFRQRFEEHRSKATCAVCHDKIDPLGFALQAYDGGGGFIANAKQRQIDTSGRLPSGETFSDFQELKRILVTSQRKRVIRTIVTRTLSYALCRKLEPHDRLTVDTIVKRLHENEGTFHDLVYEITDSLPFRQTVARSK